MQKKYLIACLIMLLLVAVTACQPAPPPPPPTPPPPPPPTPEEHAAKARGTLGPLLTDAPLPGDRAACEALVSSFSGVKSQLSATEEGRGGLAIIQREAEDNMKKMREAQRWPKVKYLCALYKILQPGSDRYAKLERDAEMMMARPSVVVTGFVQTGGEIYAFLETKDPVSGAKETFKVREGEEFYRPAKIGSQPNSSEVLRLVRIIGNQQEVEIEYKLANFLWKVPGPRTRDK